MIKQKILNIYFSIFGYFAKKYLKRHSPFVIGVTGSIGKTSCRMILSQVLKNNLPEKIIYTSDKNFNGELGMSLSILGINNYSPNIFSIFQTIYNSFKIGFYGEKKYDIIILEYGIDHIGEMDFLLSIKTPDIGIVTKIDKVHSSQFKTKQIIAGEKYKLLQKTNLLSFLNVDDEFYEIYKNTVNSNKIYYSTNYEDILPDLNLLGKNDELVYKNEVLLNSFLLCKDDKEIFKVYTNLIGKENIGYICIGYEILDFLNNYYYGNSFFESNLGKNIYIDFELQYSRFSLFEGINDSILIDSSYNCSPFSLKVVIENLIKIKNSLFQEYKIIFCLGDMRELGEYSQKEHEDLADLIVDKADEVFVVGENMKNYFLPRARELSINVKYFKNSQNLGKDLKTFLGVNNQRYLILFKGSQNTIFMEESIKFVLKDFNDAKKICRQEDFWLKRKNKFFLKD